MDCPERKNFPFPVEGTSIVRQDKVWRRLRIALLEWFEKVRQLRWRYRYNMLYLLGIQKCDSI